MQIRSHLKESQNMGTSFSFAWDDILCNLKHPFSWPSVTLLAPIPRPNPIPLHLSLSWHCFHMEATQGLSSVQWHCPPTLQWISCFHQGRDSRPGFPPQQWYAVASRPQQSSCIQPSTMLLTMQLQSTMQLLLCHCGCSRCCSSDKCKRHSGKSAAAFLNLNLKSCNQLFVFFTEPFLQCHNSFS